MPRWGANRNAFRCCVSSSDFTLMPSVSRIALIVTISLGLAGAVSNALAAESKKNIGESVVKGSATIPVHISASSPDLQGLATRAFASHGCYDVVQSREMYDFKFTAVGPAQVRV